MSIRASTRACVLSLLSIWELHAMGLGDKWRIEAAGVASLFVDMVGVFWRWLYMCACAYVCIFTLFCRLWVAGWYIECVLYEDLR